jgi:hypothetical protein
MDKPRGIYGELDRKRRPGRADWPEPGEKGVLVPGTPQYYKSWEDLSKQVEVMNRINELVGPLPRDRFTNNHLFAIAHDELGMSREEFDATDDWDFLALLERRFAGRSKAKDNESKASSTGKAVSLSERDTGVYKIVGEENFRNLTNAEIMRDRTIGSQLKNICKLKSGEDATKACLDRIRRAKGYPLSRDITNKRSTQK